MSATPLSLPAALTDVRRAYRLVQLYQRRLWDLLQGLDHLLALNKLDFVRWRPMRFATPPKQGTRFFDDRWAWDFLPAYEIGCEWEQIGKRKSLTRRVFVIAIADTGYDPSSDDEPDPVHFAPAEECATRLRVGLWTAATSSPDWSDAVRVRDKKKTLREGQNYIFEVAGAAYTYQFFLVDVAELVNPAAVQTKLHEPVTEWLTMTKG